MAPSPVTTTLVLIADLLLRLAPFSRVEPVDAGTTACTPRHAVGPDVGPPSDWA
jgi:hypothetical protein